MDRQILYPAQIPLVEDGLNAQRNAMVGLGHLAGAAFGTNTVAASGFACSPAEGLAVTIAPGALLAPGVVDASAYGTLAAVSSALVRQFISRDPVSLTVPSAGATYVVYVTPQTVDADNTVLPFYNAADPSVTYAGQNNSGLAAPTVRRDEAVLAIGSPVPSGAYPLWQIVVPAGATTLTADMLSVASGAPFYPSLAAVAPRIVAPFNAQLAAAMGGYPLNAVVADTTTPGTFWVSTADANVSTPGADGATWQSLFNGYATEAWANTTFQPVGDYATLNQVQTFTADQTIQSSNLHINNGSLILANPSGDDVAIYTDIEGKGVSKNDLVVRTNSGSSSVYTTISNNGDLVSSVHGKAAFENRQNTFNGGQTVIEQSGIALLLTAPGSLTALEFGIDGDDGLSFIDFHCQKDGGAYTDYDARIIASGGSSVASAATLDFEAANVTWQGYSLTRISDFSFNKNTNGYIILPTGFIIQWGKVNPSGGTYNFPIAFPNAVFNIVSGNSDYQGQYADTAYAWSVSTSQFRAGTKAVNTGWATTFEVSWVAFGF
ncbi:gp53-like domain-containing protein [Acetobacter orientalis]|uniref:gp53-like domain-containing protein n=1 Tax=Acetobacter orientalis TaxID=146474 RepID=UPI0039EA6991